MSAEFFLADFTYRLKDHPDAPVELEIMAEKNEPLTPDELRKMGDCPDPDIAKSMTNADHIRAMSDVELEQFINHFNICDIRTSEECKMSYCACCEACVMDWLQQPAEPPK